MKQNHQEQLDRALKMARDGVKMKEILKVTGLNYSQAWLYITDAELDEKQRIKDPHRTAGTVKRLRDEGESWGLISVRFGYREFAETKIRRMYEEATEERSQGTRIGRGGRFFAADPRLYKGVRRRKGVAIPKGMKRVEVEQAAGKLPDDVTKISGNGKVSMKTAARAEGVVKTAAKKQPAKKTTKKIAAKKGA